MATFDHSLGAFFRVVSGGTRQFTPSPGSRLHNITLVAAGFGVGGALAVIGLLQAAMRLRHEKPSDPREKGPGGP